MALAALPAAAPVPRVYASFDACGSKNPAHTDLKCYFLLRAWMQRGCLAGRLADVHQAPLARPLRQPSRAELEAELRRRLACSDLLLLILSPRTAHSQGWLDWEIAHGLGRLGLPLLCSYVGLPPAHDVSRGWPAWWPPALHRVLAERPELPVAHARFGARGLARLPAPAQPPA